MRKGGRSWKRRFKWPQETLNRPDGKTPYWTELLVAELSRGFGIISNIAAEKGKYYDARGICRLQQDILEDYVLKSVKTVLQAIELGEFTWLEHREIFFTRHVELTQSKLNAKEQCRIGVVESCPVQKPKKQKPRVCYPYQRG